MTLKDDERRILVQDRLKKSFSKLSLAKYCEETYPNESISASYYSVFHAVHALFAEYGVEIQKKRGHRGVNSIFYDRFVHSGLFAATLAKIKPLAALLENRR
jgi:uncharacterized protein (UPF0332 family)